MSVLNALMADPIIAAVRNPRDLETALEAPLKVIFLLTGDISMLPKIVEDAKYAGKLVLIHLDLVEGLGKDQAAVRYISSYTKADGMITTRGNLVKYAKDMGLFVIQRIFLLDSMSLESGIAAVEQAQPDAVEVLPGVLPRELVYCCQRMVCPIVAGGLIRTKEDIIAALNAGAIAVSTSNKILWTA